MLLEVSTVINQALSGGPPATENGFSDDLSEDEEEDDDDDLLSEDDSDAEMWTMESPKRETEAKTPAMNSFFKSNTNNNVNIRMRSDVRLTKEAGFKVGLLGDLNAGGLICVSTRISKLGISEEAMNAWGLKRNIYLVLMIRYDNGYKNIEQVKEESGALVASRTEFRVGLCEKYKPSMTEAVNAFTQLSTSQPETSQGALKAKLLQTLNPAKSNKSNDGILEPLFIGRPLNDLLRDRLPAILKYRIACSFWWTGAELFFNEIQAKAASALDPSDRAFSVGDHPASSALPKIVIADHLAEALLPSKMSLPLAAMQFVLRHLVRCTEFCLVCHCTIHSNFEALKPYVCNKPLCLFQYMALGFGPSIEWEVLSQPYVVDLLVSFCYAGARGHRLKDFPIGIGLKVPLLPRYSVHVSNYDHFGMVPVPIPSTAPSTPAPAGQPRPISAKFDTKAREVLFKDQKPPGPLKIGEWVVVTAKSLDGATTRVLRRTSFR
jgi:ubiquitin-conjugating enzyme E2 Q